MQQNNELISINQELINFINDPQNIIDNPYRLDQLIQVLGQQHINPQLEYDGSNFCCYCQEFLKGNDYKMLPCGHNVHLECFIDDLMEKPFYLESIEKNSSCRELETCSQIIITDQIAKDILGVEQFNNLQNFFLKDIINIDPLDDLLEDKPQVQQQNEQQIKEDYEFIQKMIQQEQLELQKNKIVLKFDCQICFETFDVDTQAITLVCDHRYCRQCVQEQILSLVSMGKFKENDIVCPQCNIPIDFQIIEYCVSAEFSSKIAELRIQNLDNDSKLERLVRCPGKDCPEQYYISMYLEFPTCRTCKLKFCANGCDKEHQGMTCEQYQKKVRTNQQQGEVQCPKCKIPIFKDGGCNHITCRCKHEFCFVCSKPYKPKRECNCPQMTTVQRVLDGISERFRHLFGFQ